MSSVHASRSPTDASSTTLHKLSCKHCRARKVKCNKIYPCAPCLKGGFECFFPERKKDRRPRQNRNHELLKRLAKLEAIVEQVSPDKLAQSLRSKSMSPEPAVTGQRLPATRTSSSPTTRTTSSAVTVPGDPTERQNSVSGGSVASTAGIDTSARYLSGEFWANLCNEVGGIRHTLEHLTESDSEDEATPKSTPGSDLSPGQTHGSPYYVTSPAVFGHGAAFTVDGEPRRPSPGPGMQLLEIYMRNVDPVLKIVHQPTISKLFQRFVDPKSQETIDPADEALFFAMCFAAVTSITPELCIVQLNEDRTALVLRYRSAVEVALARADYLNNSKLECLQALTLYVACLRHHHESRASWALLALVLRLAQSIGLLRDGATAPGHSPYSAEMRRRLFAQIVVLDVRAAEDRGSEPMLHTDMYNTILPSNINDDDFGPDTTTPIPEIAKPDNIPTDVTFSLCAGMCSGAFVEVHGPHARFAEKRTASENADVTHAGIEANGLDHIQRLEARFVANEDRSVYTSVIAARVVRLVSLIFMLQIQYPFRVRGTAVAGTASAAPGASSGSITSGNTATEGGMVDTQLSPPTSRISQTHALQTAVAIMELQELCLDQELRERFQWWNDMYIQWHALAVALAELCLQTEGPLIERAWKIVDKVFPLWGDRIADTKRGALWRPIRKLLRKARDARAQALLKRLNVAGDEQATAQQQSSSSGDVTSSSISAAAPSTSAVPENIAPFHLGTLSSGGDMFQTHTIFSNFGAPFPIAQSPPAQASLAIPAFSTANGTSLSADVGSSFEDVYRMSPFVDYQSVGGSTAPVTAGYGGDSIADTNVDLSMGNDAFMTDWSYWNEFVNETNLEMEL